MEVLVPGKTFIYFIYSPWTVLEASGSVYVSLTLLGQADMCCLNMDHLLNVLTD